MKKDATDSVKINVFSAITGIIKRQVEMAKVIWEAVPYSSIVLRRFMDSQSEFAL